MSKYIKPALTATAILGLFLLILVGNIYLLKINIHIASIREPDICLDPSLDLNSMACLKLPFGAVGAFNMYFSAGLFIFISLFFLKRTKYNFLPTITLPILYIVLSELIVKIFNIEVLYKGLISGRLSFDNTLYFLNGPTLILSTSITFITGLVGGGFAIMIKKFLYKSPNHA